MFEKEGKYILVTVPGKQTYEDNIKLAEVCIQECWKYAVTRVLVDVMGPIGQSGAVADYELAKLTDAWVARRTITHAAPLEKEEDPTAGKFFETAARNRGVNLFVFSDKVEAVEWPSKDYFKIYIINLRSGYRVLCIGFRLPCCFVVTIPYTPYPKPCFRSLIF